MSISFLALESCENNDNKLYPNIHFYDSYGYERNTPFNYIAFKNDHIYIIRESYSFFEESVIEIPIKKDIINKTKKITNICYYKFDINTFNDEYEKRRHMNLSKSSIELRSVIQYIFEYRLNSIPDFEGLDVFNEQEFENYRQNNCLMYAIYSPNSKKTYCIKSNQKFSLKEKKILNWLKFVTKISFVDAMYYDRLIGIYNDDDFSKYPKQTDYIISSKYWEKSSLPTPSKNLK